jgi:hypothetical protein
MSVLNLAAIDSASLEHDPFDFMVVPDAIESETIDQLNRDYPLIDAPTNHSPESLDFGPSFQELLKELDGSLFEWHVAKKFNVDLTDTFKTITVRKYSEQSDGHIHIDHPSKIITLLVYFNPEWDHKGGRLRLLRSPSDIEDYVAEIKPLGGTILAFRRCGHSFHGYKSFNGERRMIQMSWIKPSRFAWYLQQLARIKTHFLKRLVRRFV